MQEENALALFGLEEKEIKVYLALIELGTSTAQRISKKTGIIRQTVYDTIDALKSRSLVSETIISNVNHYSAADPNVLLRMEEERKQAIEKVIPQLKSKYEMQKRLPRVQTFFGDKAVEKIYNDTLSAKSETYWVEPYIIGTGLLTSYQLKNYVQRRVEKKVKINIIVDKHKSHEQKEIFKGGKELRKTRYNNYIKDFGCSFVIYDDKVAIFTVKEDKIGVIIESEPIKNTFMKIFNLLWKQSKKD